MKQAFLIATFLITSLAARADETPSNVGIGIFKTAYKLNSFQIDPNSTRLPAADTITGGMIRLNQETKELKLTIYRQFQCPKGSMCIQMVAAPIEINVPVTYSGQPFCGGHLISAEQNDLATNGDLLRIEIYDDNGNFCTHSTDIKTVNIVVTEEGPHSNAQTISKLSGIPVK